MEEEKVEKVVKKERTIALYQMRPTLQELFKGTMIKEIILSILREELQDKSYSLEDARTLTRHIADKVNAEVKGLNMKRYKHVVQVAFGQQLGSGCSYLARCLWDADCDSQATEVFTNTSIFCVCTVFGIYVY